MLRNRTRTDREGCLPAVVQTGILMLVPSPRKETLR
jgi:hypothetical protein